MPGSDLAAETGKESRILHIEALMPEHHTDHEEAYLCTSVLLPDEPLKLVGVEPLSKQEVVHHMLMFGESCPFFRPQKGGHNMCCGKPVPFNNPGILAKEGRSMLWFCYAGCDKPAAAEAVWDCHTHSVCAEAGSHVLYGWAKGAEAMHLPAGVGFRVGQGTGTRHLVLQVSTHMLLPQLDPQGYMASCVDLC